MVGFGDPEDINCIGRTGGSCSDWQCLDNVWYRKQELFDMKWIDFVQKFELFVISVAPFGGPIAVVRNEKVFQPARRSHKPELQIFTAQGKLIASTNWTFSRMICMAWNHEETLICVFQDAVVRTFSSTCEKLHFFSLHESIKNEGGIIEAHISTCGIVVLTAGLNVYVNRSFHRCEILHMPSTGLRGPPTSFCVIPGQPINAFEPTESQDLLTTSKVTSEPVIMFGSETGSLYLLNQNECVDLNIEDGPFISMSLSRSGKLLACISAGGQLKVISTSGVPSVIASVSLENQRKSKQLQWCGDDCIAMYMPMTTPSGNTQHILLLGGPKNEWIPYQYGLSSSGNSSLLIVSEIDGIRIISTFTTDFIHRVPRATDSIFSIGSCEPSAMLVYAMERFRAGDAVADESLRSIKHELNDAIKDCIDAALCEWQLEDVTLLLQAAVFGKQYIHSDAEEICRLFVKACRDLRICFAVRQSPLEMPLTVSQLREMKIEKLVRIIANRREHLLAYRICQYVGIHPKSVLTSWAVEKINNSLSLTDEELAQVVCSKLFEASFIPTSMLSAPSSCSPKLVMPFAKVALCAARAGRPILSTRLIDFEPSVKEQIFMLLKLAEVEKATEKAVEEGDLDLVLQCVSTALAQSTCSGDEKERDYSFIIRLLHDKPLAYDIFYQYCRETGHWLLLHRYLEGIGKLYKSAVVAMSNADLNVDWEEKKTWLSIALGLFNSSSALNELASFAHTITIDQIELLNTQRNIEVKANSKGWVGGPHRFRGLSIMQTIRQLILKGEFQEADSLQRQFKVPDKRYWRCKIDALADGGHFDELLSFAHYRTSPVGYELFILACLRNMAREPAIKLIARIKDLEHQALWYGEMGLYAEATASREAHTQSGGIFQTITEVFKRR